MKNEGCKQEQGWRAIPFACWGHRYSQSRMCSVKTMCASYIRFTPMLAGFQTNYSSGCVTNPPEQTRNAKQCTLQSNSHFCTPHSEVIYNKVPCFLVWQTAPAESTTRIIVPLSHRSWLAAISTWRSLVGCRNWQVIPDPFPSAVATLSRGL